MQSGAHRVRDHDNAVLQGCRTEVQRKADVPLVTRQVKEEYMKCLKDNKHDSEKCKGVAKKYLECRMSK